MNLIAYKPTIRDHVRISLQVSTVVLLLLISARANGGGFEALHNFGTNRVGIYPMCGLVPGPDGFLYGTAEQGGAANCGQVFKVRPNGSDYTALKDFTGPDGLAPWASVMIDGSWVYGTTQYGGTNGGFGTVFKVGTNGESFTILKHLRESEGACPMAGLSLLGDALYGTASGGGSDFGGTVFKVNTDGTGFAVLKHFTPGVEGHAPWGGVVLSGTTLYGTTCGGGEYSVGVLFALQTDGSGYTVLKHFNPPEGASPGGDLLLDSGVLYGTLSNGGIDDAGTVFAINTDGSGFRVVHYFRGNQVVQPWSGVVLQGSTLYGSTVGDVGGYGAVFRMETNGNNFEVLKVFSDLAADGGYPSGLAISGTTIYGSLGEGAYGEYGALFSINTDGTGYDRFFDFSGGDGQRPVQSMLLADETLYGITESGGIAGWGTLYRIGTNGGGYAILKDFTNYWEGISPQSSPVLLGSTLYSTAGYGGSNDHGSVYRVGIDGEGFTVLHQFDGVTGYPKGNLTLAGSTLYGATRFSEASAATIFKMQTDGSDFGVLRTFQQGAEGEPDGGLLISDNIIYGVAWNTPTNQGMIYRINTDGTGYQVLKYLSVSDGGHTAPDGAYPLGGLVLSGTTLYGVAEGGGSFGSGTVFRLSTDGTAFTVLHEFDWYEGAHPKAPLVLSGATLFGTTTTGGAFGSGTIFKIEVDGSRFAVLHHLQANAPQAGLTSAGDAFFGTCSYGGFVDCGLLFRFSPGPPVIQVMPEESQSINYGSVLELHAIVSGFPEPAFQWQHNGTNVPGATAASLILSNVTGKDSGVYMLILSNSYGAVISPPVTVSVVDPWINEQPAARTIKLGETATFSALIQGTEPLTFQWFKGSAPLQDGGRFSGAQTSSLVISNTVLADEGSYHLVVSNEFGLAESVPASLSVQDPFIIANPAHTNVAPGRPVSVSILAGGTGPFSYQWSRNGQTLAGATGSTLAFVAARASDAGLYKAVVSNGSRSLESTGAWLTVNLAIPDSFAPPATAVSCLALEPDGKVVVGGYLRVSWGQWQNYLGRLNLDGSVDTTFRPVLNQQVRAVAVQADGRIVIGGDFTEVNGRSALRIARLNPSGTLDESFAANCNEMVYALLVQPDGKIVIGGNFWRVNSVARSHIARLNPDGTLDAAFGAEASAPVNCLALQPDGKIVIGGRFFSVAGYPRRMIARLNANGLLDTDFEVSPNPEIWANATALALQPDGKIVVGGWWSAVSGQGGSFRLGRVNPDGSWDGGFAASLNQDCYGLAVQPDGRVLVVGTFTSLSESPTSYLGRLLPDGRIDPTLNPAPDTPVKCLHLQAPGKLLVGGHFNVIGGQARSAMARLDLLESPQPVIAPASQTVEAGAITRFWVRDKGNPLPVYQWCFGGVPLSGQTNPVLQVPVDSAGAGFYTVVASNVADCATSAQAVLSIIPPVNRRLVPAIPAPELNVPPMQVEFSDDLGPVNWTPLEPFILSEAPQLYFDLTAPTPPRRFYRAWRDVGHPPLLLNLAMFPEITLTGSPRDSIRIDWINPVGPTDAWTTLATVVLTNSTHRYYDLTYQGHARLYRVVPVP